MDEAVCCICGRSEDRTRDERAKFACELRPYGPGGAPICYQCATSTPEREAEAERNFGAILDGATAMGGGVATITDHGIEPGAPQGKNDG